MNAHMQALLALPNPSNNMTSFTHFMTLHSLDGQRTPMVLYLYLKSYLLKKKKPGHPTIQWTIDRLREAI